jgi:hypothetical protein
MLIRSINGEVKIPFGKQHEVVYEFTGDPALAEITDEEHARLLLASPHLYAAWEGPRPKAKPKKNEPAAGEPRPEFDLTDAGEPGVNVLIRISSEAHIALQAGTHGIFINEKEDGINLLPPEPDLLDQLDQAESLEQLRALADKSGVAYTQRWRESKLRAAIREQLTVGEVFQPTEGEEAEA